MKFSKIPQFLLIIFVLLLPNISYSSDLIRKEMSSGISKREYLVHIPSSYRPDLALPMAFVFHGGGGNAEQIAQASGFNKISEENGFLVIYPEAIDKHWNDGRESEKFRAHDEKINDVAWIGELLTTLKMNYPVDSQRIYATGISNGGIFAQRLAIEMSQHFAAVASLAAQIAEPLATAQPTHPISVLIMNGTKDPFVPYEGGAVTPALFPRFNKMMKRPSRGKVISTDATIEFWLGHNGIKTTGMVTTLPDLDKTDESTAKRTEWTNRNTNVSVVLYTILGGGHTWPGGKQYLPVRTIGQTCKDFDASKIIWDFFAEHPKTP